MLYHKERETGATVHYMDTRIDNGGILGQEVVPIEARATMIDVIRTTKRVGSELMVRVVQGIAAGTVSEKENRGADGSYFGWSSVEQMRHFRRQGDRLS
ncbi:MAG: formyltransferase family protein [Planctomycetia bacterium]|nr:formyltransferase family protein [Planctomycetia bacterium]